MKRNNFKKIKRVKKLCPVYKCRKFVTSIKRFLSLGWVKRVGKHPLVKQWFKRKKRAKKEIKEYKYTEFTCNNCKHLIGKICAKHYISYPEETCNDFRE